MLKSFIAASFLRNLSNRYIDNSVCRELLENITQAVSYCKNAVRLRSGVIALGQPTMLMLNTAETFDSHNRIVVNGTLLYTHNHSTGIKTCINCYITVDCFKSPLLILTCVMVKTCDNLDCLNDVHSYEECVLLVNIVKEELLLMMDPDIRCNLTCHIKKASIDKSRVVAVKAKDGEK